MSAKMWEQSNCANNLDPMDKPWPFHVRRRDAESATRVADFAEMICQIDKRLDRTLPAGWMQHGFLFALMDALRCEYSAAYVGSYNQKNKFVEAASSRDQFQFWVDENTAVEMVKEYCQQEGITKDEDGAGPMDSYTHATKVRRQAEKDLGIEAIEYFPYSPNNLAPVAPPPAPHVPPADTGGTSAGEGQDIPLFD